MTLMHITLNSLMLSSAQPREPEMSCFDILGYTLLFWILYIANWVDVPLVVCVGSNGVKQDGK